MRITEHPNLTQSFSSLKVGQTFRVHNDPHVYLKMNYTPVQNAVCLMIEDESYIPITTIFMALTVTPVDVTVDFNTLPF